MKTLLFIPMYNCEKQIVRVISALKQTHIEDSVSEIIIVNNRSTDNGESVAAEAAANAGFTIPVKVLRNNDNYGLGGSHKVAFEYARENGFEYLVVFHGDDQGEASDIHRLLEKAADYDCVLGARFMKGSVLRGYSKFRTFGNRVYDLLFSIGCGKMIYDLGAGLNVYRVDSFPLESILKFKDNLEFNYGMILGSVYRKQKFCFVPITWKEEDQVSNVKLTKQAMSVLKLLWLYVTNKKKFFEIDHRTKAVSEYSSEEVFTNRV